jgi:streptogramin lyase
MSLLPDPTEGRTRRSLHRSSGSHPADGEQSSSTSDHSAAFWKLAAGLGTFAVTTLTVVGLVEERLHTPLGRLAIGAVVAAGVIAAGLFLRQLPARSVPRTAALLLLGVLVGVVLGILLTRDTGTSPPDATVEPPVQLGQAPRAVNAASSGVWVITFDSTLLRVDPEDPYAPRRTPIPLPGPAFDVASGSRAVFVTVGGDALAFDAHNGQPLWHKHDLAKTNSEIEFRYGALWFKNYEAGLLVRLDPNNGRVLKTVHLPHHQKATALTMGFHSLWVTTDAPDAAPDKLLRYDLKGRYQAAVALDRPDPQDLAAGERYLFVAHAEGSLVSRIDPLENEVAGRPVELSGSLPSGVAGGSKGVWIAAADSGTVTQLSEPKGHFVRKLTVGNYPLDAVVWDHRVWVPVEKDMTLVPIRIGDGD